MEDSEEEGDDEMRKDNVVRLHKMGRDNLIRSDEEGDNLLRSEEMRDNLRRSDEEEENLIGSEVDVMTRLFQWDFDQLLRQDLKLK